MKKKYIFGAVLVFILTLLTVITVSATVTWNTYPGPTDNPAWSGGNYQYDVGVTLSGSDHYVCISYSLDSWAHTTNALCSCPDANCSGYDGTWSCEIPGPQLDATIDWRMGTDTNTDCNPPTAGTPFGQFSTNSTTAIEVGSFEAREGQNNLVAMLPILAIAALALVAMIAVLLWRYKVRVSPKP